MQYQTIGHDKLNMLRHVKFFGSADGMRKFMKKHADIMRPKFDIVLNTLEKYDTSIYRTDIVGSVTIECFADNYTVSTER